MRTAYVFLEVELKLICIEEMFRHFFDYGGQQMEPAGSAGSRCT